jgi:hypothetical protein
VRKTVNTIISPPAAFPKSAIYPYGIESVDNWLGNEPKRTIYRPSTFANKCRFAQCDGYCHVATVEDRTPTGGTPGQFEVWVG